MTLLWPEMLRADGGQLYARAFFTRSGDRFDSIETEKALGDHQHVEDDHRRQAENHRPDAQCPKNVFGGKALMFREWIILSTHNAPALAFYAYLIHAKF